jgi:uncharacterized protein (DUF934 family)
MRIIRDRRISESHWRHAPDGVLADAQGTRPSGAIIVTLAAWRRSKTEYLRRGAPLGVRLGADDDLDEIVDDLDSIALVALEFASFTEGRAYTYARKLRQRHGYRGEIRAVGDVSRDRLAFMERCGFNAYELRSDDQLQDALNAFAEISDVYQACADARPVIASRRA